VFLAKEQYLFNVGLDLRTSRLVIESAITRLLPLAVCEDKSRQNIGQTSIKLSHVIDSVVENSSVVLSVVVETVILKLEKISLYVNIFYTK
jgi:hypothetical protein